MTKVAEARGIGRRAQEIPVGLEPSWRVDRERGRRSGRRPARFVAETPFEALPKPAVEMGRLAMLDWWGVTVGGVDEPVTRLLREAGARARRAGVGPRHGPHGLAGHGGSLERHRLPRAGLRRHRARAAGPRHGAAPAGTPRARGDAGRDGAGRPDGLRARRRGHVPRLARAGAGALPRGLARHGDARAARRRGGVRPAARPRRRGDRPGGRAGGGPARRDPRVVRDHGEALPGRPRGGRRAPGRARGRRRDDGPAGILDRPAGRGGCRRTGRRRGSPTAWATTGP